MKTFELVINEEQNDLGVYAISMVESPAIEIDFVALNNHEDVKLQSYNEDKMVVVGAALVPDKPIYRVSPSGEEYNIVFSKDTVRIASQIYMRDARGRNVTIEHAYPTGGVYLTESWIVEDKEKDKSNFYNLDVPVGTWMISMKVDNKDVWSDVKKGRLLGFSIEGMFKQNELLSRDICERILKIIEA